MNVHATLVETIGTEKKNVLILRLQLQNQKCALLAINVIVALTLIVLLRISGP